jgi:L-alanine-DL-glutamate epimerase-like enolase superfamily enzyme
MNAIWDLWAKMLDKPVWRVVADMSPEMDFHEAQSSPLEILDCKLSRFSDAGFYP